MKKNKDKYIFIIIYFLIIVATIVSFFLTLYGKVFTKSQSDFKNSIRNGYGYYSDPVEGICFTSDGKCNKVGKKTITKKCIINPVTKKGCLLEDGTMSYDNLVETVTCKKECASSNFIFNNGVEFSKLEDNEGNIFEIPTNSGGGYLVNNLGIDYTDTFIDSFDAANNTYKLKRCLNSQDEFLAYSVNYYESKTGDQRLAGNKSIFVCGVDDPNVLRQTFSKDVDTGIVIYDYPKENGLYSCLDVYGNNQIEILNSGTVPQDFIYPSFCYKHIEKNNDSTELVLINNILSNQEYLNLDIDNLTNYNIIYDYNFYYPLDLGNSKEIISSLFNQNYRVEKNKKSAPYLYVELSFDPGSGFFINGNRFTINSSFEKLQKNNIIGINMDLLGNFNSINNSDYYYDTNTAYFNYTGITLNVGDFIYYKISNPNIDTKSNIAKINYIDTSLKYFGISVPDLGENAYTYGVDYFLLNNYISGNIKNITDGNTGTSLALFIENGDYFISDFLLPQDNFSSRDSQDIKVNIYSDNFTSETDNIFYLYSESKRSFSYPVTLSSDFPNSTSFTIEEYGDTIFYLLENGSKDTIFPPDKNTNYKDFRETINFLEAKVYLDSYKNIYKNFIKSYSVLSSSFKNNNQDSTFYVFEKNFNIKENYTLVNKNNFIFENISNLLVKRLGSLPEDIDSQTTSEENNFVEKMKIYNGINNLNNNFFNDFGTSFSLTISPLKAVLKIADLNVFKTPNIIDSETGEVKSKNVCFDSFGKPLQVGTKIQLNPGEKIVYYKKQALNSSDYLCGFYGVSEKEIVEIERIESQARLGTSVLVSRDNSKYYNYLDYLESGYNIEDLYCYKGVNKNLVESNISNCREPFTTRLATDSYYNPGENLFENYINTDLYISNINNNTDPPNTAKSWSVIKDYNNINLIYKDSLVYENYRGYNFIYSANNLGVKGESLSRSGVYYLYKKSSSIYSRYTPNLYNSFLSILTEFTLNDKYYKQIFPKDTAIARQNLDLLTFFKNNPWDIRRLYDTNVELPIQEDGLGTSLYSFNISIDVGASFSTGDTFNPDFNFFNNILMFNPVPLFTFESNSGYDNLIGGSSIINNATVNDRLKIGNLIFISYSDPSPGIIENNAQEGAIELFNYAFEVCKVLDFNVENKTVNLERNLLNYPITSNYSALGLTYAGYLLDENFDTNLTYKINKVQGSTITFNFSSYSLSTPDTNLINFNLKPFSASSARIIKQNISIANSQVQNTNLYLKDSPSVNRVIAYLDLILKTENNDTTYSYYFNQYREDNYLNNKKETFFYIGDKVNITIGGNIYKLTITRTKIVYNNSLYDYKATSTTNIESLTPDSMKNFIKYYNTGNMLTNAIPLKNTVNVENPDSLTVINPSTGASLLKSNLYSSLYYRDFYEKFPTLNILDTETSQFFVNNLQSSIDIDIYNGLPTISLASTRLYDNLENTNNYITIDNITLNCKPYGPSYLKNLATSNNLDLEGYGTITGFTVEDVNNINPSSDIILTSRSGFKFSFSDLIPSFNFKTLTRHRDINILENKNIYTKNNPPEYSISDSYNTNDTVYFKYTKNLIYKNISNEIALFDEGTSWKMIPNSIYPVDNLSEYNDNLFYNSGDLVLYKDNVYSSLLNNNGTSPNFFIEDNWALNSYSDLFNANSYFYNKNIGVSTVATGLSLVSKTDTLNYPFSLIDYTTNRNYTLETGTKGIIGYSDKFSQSFLDLDIFSKQKEILNKALIFKNNGNIKTLATSPVTKDNIQNYQFLKNYSVYSLNETLSQYIYTVNLPDIDFTGKAFCTGNTPFNSNVSNYTFANSIVFLPVPVDLEYQDYPSIVYKNSDSVYYNPPLSIPNGTNKAIRDNNGNYSLVDIGISNSYITTIEEDYNFNSIFKGGFIIEGGGESLAYFYITDTSYYYYVNVKASENYKLNFNEVIDIYINQPWYIKDKDNNIIASGFVSITTNFIGVNSIFTADLFVASVNEELVAINNYNYTLYISNTTVSNCGITPIPNGMTIILSDTGIIVPGNTYDFVTQENKPLFSAIISKEIQSFEIVSFSQYTINYTSETLEKDDTLYFLPSSGMSSLKVKMYGFFGRDYLSRINYSNNTNISTLGLIPGLIFSPHKNNLLNPYNNKIELVDSNGVNPVITTIPENDYSDVFNLDSNENGLTLFTNFYKKPIFNNNNINSQNTPLIGTLGLSPKSRLGSIFSNSVTNLISEPFDFNDYIIVGDAQDVIPFSDTQTKNSHYYRDITNNNNNDPSSNLNCSIYNTGLKNVYRLGAPLEVVIAPGKNNGKILNVLVEGVSNSFFTDNNVGSIFYNSSFALQQNFNTSNNSLPLYVGMSGGTSFSKSLVYDNKTFDSDSDISISYFLNGIGVSSKAYYTENSKNYNYSNFLLSSINIVLTNSNYSQTIEDKKLYLGYKDTHGDYIQFSDGLSILNFTDNI